MRYIVLIFVLLIAQWVKAERLDSVTIYGSAVEYANMNLTIQRQSNYITRDFKDLRSFRVSKKGDFITSFFVDDVTKIYINLGEMQGYLFVEPGKSYNIELPPYIPMKEENKLNPFFIPEPVLLGVNNENSVDLNRDIKEFNLSYNQKFADNIKKIVLTNNKKLAYQIIDETESEFPASRDSWFQQYKSYSYINLKNFINSNQKRKLINDNFSHVPVQYSLDPYWDAFNQVFSNFFYSYFNSKEGEKVKDMWPNVESFDSLAVAFEKDSLFYNRTLTELVVIKGLYDGFYSGNYNKEKIITLMKRASEECNSDINKEIAGDIFHKFTKLRVGLLAPSFSLTTLSGKSRELKDFHGKFIYLNFANTENYACKKDFQILSQFAEMFKKDMVIVTILTDEDPDKAYEFVKKHKYKWNFLHFSQNAKVLLDYDIKAFPTYYLIDPEGNLIFAPAPGPEENFVPMFSETYNEWRYEKMRKDKPKARTIYDL